MARCRRGCWYNVAGGFQGDCRNIQRLRAACGIGWRHKRFIPDVGFRGRALPKRRRVFVWRAGEAGTRAFVTLSHEFTTTLAAMQEETWSAPFSRRTYTIRIKLRVLEQAKGYGTDRNSAHDPVSGVGESKHT